jgi:hypothetical protein
LGIPCRTIIQRERWNSNNHIVWSKAVSEIWQQALPRLIVATTLLRSVGGDEDSLNRAGEAVIATQVRFLDQQLRLLPSSFSTLAMYLFGAISAAELVGQSSVFVRPTGLAGA